VPLDPAAGVVAAACGWQPAEVAAEVAAEEVAAAVSRCPRVSRFRDA